MNEISTFILDLSDKEVQKINDLMQSMQSETVNNGGTFHFSLLFPTMGNNSNEKLKNLLSKLAFYQNPFSNYGEEKIYQSSRDLNNLRLLPIENFKATLLELCDKWSQYHGCCPERDVNSEEYPVLRNDFINRVISFLELKKIKSCSIIEGINTEYSVGFDFVNEEILIETEERLYIIHFGVSS
jgi:hypothetical protein